MGGAIVNDSKKALLIFVSIPAMGAIARFRKMSKNSGVSIPAMGGNSMVNDFFRHDDDINPRDGGQ